ncbi:MAG TPA: hypothetical protein VGE97_04770 [Nitrososphaera sp.]
MPQVYLLFATDAIRRTRGGCKIGTRHTAVHRVPKDVLQDVFNTPPSGV